MKHLHLTLLALLISFASFATAPITGVTGFCLGTTTSLADATPGGTWSSSTPTIATVSSTGVAIGMGVGTTTISYVVGTSTVTTTVTVYPLPAPLAGPTSVCVGSSITITDPTPGGVWSTSYPGISLSMVTGVATGLSAGTAVITYALGTGCFVTETVTVLPNPSAIAGPTSICTGSSVTMSSTPSGGIWSSSSTGVATVGSASGVVTGIAPGVDVIYYTIPTGCMTSTLVTVSSTPAAGPLTGPSVLCTSSTITLTGATPGGTWVSSTPAVATVDASGNVTGLTAGTTTITYTLPTACGSGTATTVVTVSTIASAGTISGTPNVCVGNTTALSSTVAGGTWSSSDLSVGTVSTAGVVYGAVAGTVNITYTITLSCGTSSAVTNVTVNPLGTITLSGPGAICIGGTTTLNAIPGSGTWSTASSILTVDIFGVVTGVASGAAAVTYTTPAGCLSTYMITINPAATAGVLSGSTSVSEARKITITSTVAGGTWSLTNAHATIGSLTGVVTGVTAGLDTVIYTVSTPCGLATAMWGVTVVSAPSAGSITGTGSVCVGLTTALSDLVTGGTWSSGSSSIATVGSASGIVTGVAPGTAVITYIVTLSCGTASTNTVVTVTPTAGTITGTASLCPSSTTVLVEAIPGGTWSSSVTSVATIGSATGVVTSLAAGTTMITYSMPGGCITTRMVTVYALPTISISSTPASCGGTFNVAASGGVSYTWAPATGVTCSTCGTTIINPSSTTVYTVTGTDLNGCVNAANTTIAGDRVYGHIYYTGVTPSSLSTKVWLIQYNPSDSSITATDSLISCVDGGVSYYEFDSKPAGNYLVKAKLASSVPGTSDYIPTYGSSDPSWYTATNISHTATASDNMNITMLYGTVPPGPGFISGNVYSGAGKGTAGWIPVAGMLVYLRDAYTWTVVTYTYTDAAGAYSFSGIGNGSYVIYPEDYKYYTTPSATINIGSATSFTGVSFKQGTTSHTILPVGATNVTPVALSNNISLYPNPTTGALNIQWAQQATGTADVVVTDVLGRQVFTSVININAVSGNTQTDLSSLTPGIYFINIKSQTINYSSKLRVE